MPIEINGNRLRRNPRKGMLFGVCAGIADYFGFDLTITRVLMVVAALFNPPMMVIAYLVLALLMPRLGGEKDSHDGLDDPVRHRVRAQPHETLAGVRYRFRDLDLRLQKIEKYVTSDRFRLDREFAKLKD
jgi:phage shock protein C